MPLSYLSEAEPLVPQARHQKREILFGFLFFGDPYRIRTDVKGVRGLCLNHLTNGPYKRRSIGAVWSALRDSNPGPTD